MSYRFTGVSLALLTLAAAPAQAESVDMDALTRWSQAKVVHYHGEGVYQAQTVIAYHDTSGQATVTDHVTIDFDWDINKEHLVGAVKIGNAKSTLKDLRNVETSCPPPKPAGEFEYIDATSGEQTARGRLDLKGTTTYPTIEVTAYCRGSWQKKTVQANKEAITVYAPVLNPMVLAIPMGNEEKLVVAPDKKSFSITTEAWTWTYTPTVVSQ